MSQPAQTEGQGTESKDAGRGPDARLLEINALSVSIGSTHIIKNLSLESAPARYSAWSAHRDREKR